METNVPNDAPAITAKERQCIVDVLGVLVTMDINHKTERVKNEKGIPKTHPSHY